jgi:hypothetical protein
VFKSVLNVISLHFSRICDLQCPFCYRARGIFKEEKPRQFFLNLIPYIKKLAPQIALGGGEPLLDLPFVKKMANTCKHNHLAFNFTTNGKKISEMSDDEILNLLLDVQMVSVSFDYFKWGKEPNKYAEIIQRIKHIIAERRLSTREIPFQIGTNLLLDRSMLKNQGLPFLQIILWLFHKVHIDRIFVLYPKYGEFLDVLSIKPIFLALTNQFSHFYVDDSLKQILEEGYKNWQHPCHYGRDFLSIDEQGRVYGCSFDTDPLFILNQPKDLLKVTTIQVKERYECPYIPYGI